MLLGIQAISALCIFRSIYTDSRVATLLGTEAHIAIDIAHAKGSTEAVVESAYSKMQSQSIQGGQSNETVALRY